MRYQAAPSYYVCSAVAASIDGISRSSRSCFIFSLTPDRTVKPQRYINTVEVHIPSHPSWRIQVNNPLSLWPVATVATCQSPTWEPALTDQPW